jgi:hypothetical protein
MSLEDTQVDMAPKLPPEVVVLIFSYLQKAELKPLRFVGREFNDLIIPFLFDKVYISPQYLNLEVFGTSLTIRTSQSVRELIYDATMFALGTDKVSYLTHLYHGSALIDCRNRSRMMRLVVTASTTSIPKIKKR